MEPVLKLSIQHIFILRDVVFVLSTQSFELSGLHPVPASAQCDTPQTILASIQIQNFSSHYKYAGTGERAVATLDSEDRGFVPCLVLTADTRGEKCTRAKYSALVGPILASGAFFA